MQKVITFILLLMMGTTLHAKNAPHVHGSAQINMVINQAHIHLDVIIPAESVLGFEHIPSTPEEKKALTTAKSQLETLQLFKFYKKTRFFKKESVLKVTRSKQTYHYSHDQAEMTHHGHHHGHQKDHAEFHLTITYENLKKSHLTAISTELFDAFSHLENIILTFIHNETAQTIKWDPTTPKLALPSTKKKQSQ